LKNDILSLARRIHKTQIKWRRHMHKYPEVSDQEYETTTFLRKEAKGLGLKLLPLNMATGVLAEIKGSRPGPTVAIRADIDALPVLEQTGLPFASKNKGRMHACGHDAHTAIALGTAAVLMNMRDHLQGNVRFLFQPAEEMPPGGARPMIANGALKNVATIFGVHVDPHLAVGKIGLRDGPAMASVYDFDLIIKGKGGHAARPQTAIDAITTAAEVVNSIQKIVSREIDPVTPVAITFGKIEGGAARNVVADSVTLAGTARTFAKAARKKVPALIRRTVAGVCRAHGAGFEIIEAASYPVLVNDAATNRLFARNQELLFGKKRVVEAETVLGGEDFACYLLEVPGAWMRLGVMNKKIGADQPWHSPRFIIDEEAMYYGTALLAAATIDYMNRYAK
ncbi:MAG: amidohydrolase, partial [Desulfobacterales bacterium]|nr:amidohydrolase [Desulfobacterales bacterium]